MLRRDFLKLCGLVSAAFFVQINHLGKAIRAPVETEAQGKVYRGTPDGKIYVSADAGNAWHLHTNFGPSFSVLGLATDRAQQVYAHLRFEDHSFELVLAQNGKAWKTI